MAHLYKLSCTAPRVMPHSYVKLIPGCVVRCCEVLATRASLLTLIFHLIRNKALFPINMAEWKMNLVSTLLCHNIMFKSGAKLQMARSHHD